MTRSVIGSFAIVLVGWLACQSAQSVAGGNVANDSTSTVGIDEPQPAHAEWSTSAVHVFSRFSSDRPAWRTDAVAVRRHVPRRSTYSVELGLVGRHGEDDPFLALDMYRNFGSRTYGNLRLGVSPGARVIPRSDIFLEAFHSPGNGWEFSAGYRRADYVNSGANTWLVGAGKYIGNWYLRARQSATQVEGSMGYALLGTVRRYFGASDEFVGLA
ncbi:MAG: YaiO family outer membrane beta-barrel protein, partial [Rhodothermales bacterium]|nr:YaiO family outer membrane beta-barrel protein [Rhodothermales bacterium]